MINLLSVITVFIAILSQTLFFTPSNVVYGNILSLLVLIPFVMKVFIDKKIIFNKPVLCFVLLNFLWFLSILWHPNGDRISLSLFRPFIFIPIFIVVLYNLLQQKECRTALQWAVIVCVFVNFIIYLTGLGGAFWGEIFSEKRFQGTFENPNGAALLFFTGMVFCFLYLESSKVLVRALAWTGGTMAVVLIIATASKKGAVLLAVAMILLLPSYLKNLSLKQLTVFICFISLAGVAVFQYRTHLNLENRVEFISYRMEKFIEDIDSSEYGGGSTAERRYFIEVGLEHFWDSPVFGHGALAFGYTFGRYAHNNYIELLFNGGLIALFLYYSMHCYCLLGLRYLRDRKLRLVICFLLIFLLLTDLAAVTYSTKFMLYILFFCIAVVDDEAAGRGIFKKTSISSG